MAEFINRDLHELLIRMAGWFPVVSLTGPRQSGKSTLVRHAFPDYSYVTLEDPQTRRAALEDPVSFIRNRKGGLIIDEAQYAPDLFSMIQVVSDERGDAGQYISPAISIPMLSAMLWACLMCAIRRSFISFCP